MGEIADMMLDGTLCAGCGEYIGESDWGIPMYCGGCQPDFDGAHNDWGFEEKPPKTVQCTVCSKMFRSETAMKQHRAAKHKEKVHPCPECKKRFSTEEGAHAHHAAVHAANPQGKP